MRERLANLWRAQFAVVVDALQEHFASTATTLPIPVDALAHLFIAIFERLSRARAVDPALASEDLFVVLVDFVEQDALNREPRPPIDRP